MTKHSLRWKALRSIGITALGAAVGVFTFHSMESLGARLVAGSCMGAALALLFFLERHTASRVVISLGSSALVFVALVVLWANSPSASTPTLLIAVGVAALIAWGVFKI
jgi:hypothetical protein